MLKHLLRQTISSAAIDQNRDYSSEFLLSSNNHRCASRTTVILTVSRLRPFPRRLLSEVSANKETSLRCQFCLPFSLCQSRSVIFRVPITTIFLVFMYLRYDTVREFNADWKAECARFNLSHETRNKKNSQRRNVSCRMTLICSCKVHAFDTRN